MIGAKSNPICKFKGNLFSKDIGTGTLRYLTHLRVKCHSAPTYPIITTDRGVLNYRLTVDVHSNPLNCNSVFCILEQTCSISVLKRLICLRIGEFMWIHDFVSNQLPARRILMRRNSCRTLWRFPTYTACMYNFFLIRGLLLCTIYIVSLTILMSVVSI